MLSNKVQYSLMHVTVSDGKPIPSLQNFILLVSPGSKVREALRSPWDPQSCPSLFCSRGFWSTFPGEDPAQGTVRSLQIPLSHLQGELPEGAICDLPTSTSVPGSQYLSSEVWDSPFGLHRPPSATATEERLSKLPGGPSPALRKGLEE